MKAVALIDGEHAPDVVRQALRELPYEWVGAILAGGTEKLREGESFGVPLVEGFTGAEVLVDLSDEPVTSPDDRLRWASRRARGRPLVRRRRLPLRPAGLRAVRAAVDRGDRDGQARGEDRPLGAPGEAARPRARRRGRDDGAGRTARARARGVAARRGVARRAVALRPPRCLGPPGDRSRRRRADDRLPAGGRRAGRAGRSCPVFRTARAWRPPARPTSSSSTGAERRSRRWRSTAACSSSARATT